MTPTISWSPACSAYAVEVIDNAGMYVWSVASDYNMTTPPVKVSTPLVPGDYTAKVIWRDYQGSSHVDKTIGLQTFSR